VVRVADRFGDYGLVGVVIFERAADRYKVDTFLLSCRVLGRGVEHAILAEVGRRARADGKRLVELAYRPTDKNAPVREFITRLGAASGNEAGTSWTFAADRLATLQYNPDDAPAISAAAEQGSNPAAPDAGARPAAAGRGPSIEVRSEPLQHIAEHLSDIGRIASAVEDFRRRQEPLPGAPVEVASRGPLLTTCGTLQATLLDIWRKVLGRSRIGVNDNFFEAGGTSLRAVQVIALIKKELNRNLAIVTLFECPTVTLLAAKLSAASSASEAGASTPEAARRGQRRRNVTRRKAS
jgi:hypothetical protein